MEKIISPAVTFKETDLSSIPQQFNNINTVFVGTTPKGKYFVPKTINSFSEYEELYGGVSDDEYMGLAIREFIREKGSATVLPVANVEGYPIPWVTNIIVSGSSGELTVAQIYPSNGSRSEDVDSVNVSGSLESFELEFLEGVTSVFTHSGLSLYNEDVNFIGNYNNPLSDDKGFYVKYISDINVLASGSSSSGGFTDIILKGDTNISVETSEFTPSGSALSEGRSPWVLSQAFGGSYNKLFKFKTRQEGDSANRKVKFDISNIRTAGDITDPDADFGLFDVTIRAYDDTESNQTVLESFVDVSLNPDDTNYIARVIGDKNINFDEGENTLVENGFYSNASDYIYVDVGNLEDIPKNAVPFGFERYDHSGTYFFAGATPAYIIYPDNTDGRVSGVNFDGLPNFFIDSLHKELSDENGFLDVGTDKPDEAFILSSSVENTAGVDRRFVFGTFGSSKGTDESVPKNIGDKMTSSNTFGLDFSSTTSNGYLSYARAIDIISDDEAYDLKLLVIPAINMEDHGDLVAKAISTVEFRKDVFLILDASGLGASVSTTKLLTSGYDTSYAGAYYPWVQFNNGGKITEVPPSVVVPSAYAYNDKVSHPWYAPLGFNRGVLFNAVKPIRKLLKDDRDELIIKNANPITSILNEGTVILGQETLQRRNTALSKINVRRLLIEAKKFIATVSWKLIGEPNTPNTRARLQSTINSYLEGVRQDNGLETFRVDFGPDVNTPDVINRKLIRGIIELVPSRSVEGIQINFVVRNSGVTFND